MISWTEAAADLCRRVGVAPGEVDWHGTSTGLGGPFPVDALAMGSVATAGLAAARWRGAPVGPVVDAARVGSSFRADQLAGGGFAPLSGFFRAADGWVRTHANYAHHRDRLVGVLGGDDDVAARIRAWPARELEDAVTAAGGIAVAVRTRDEWLAEGHAVAAEPLVHVRRRERAGRPVPERPRVLDLTRVIAGPVATRTLALLGADVLRVDPPGLPELAAQHADTGIGKRTTVLDAGSVTFAGLLAEADVLVLGYRPGALDAHGLDLEHLRLWYPHLVVVRLDAWGWTGPWAGRRGFDSIVQAACGIAERCGDGTTPGALPAQALDHATGYLAAASAIVGLLERPSRGASVRDLSLARTAEWLWDSGPAGDVAPIEPITQSLGDARVPPPPLGTGSWDAPAHLLGSDAPAWAG